MKNSKIKREHVILGMESLLCALFKEYPEAHYLFGIIYVHATAKGVEQINTINEAETESHES